MTLDVDDSNVTNLSLLRNTEGAELRMRYGFRRLLVFCPAALRASCRLELRQRFSIEVRIADAA